jgi:hypothetical protein
MWVTITSDSGSRHAEWLAARAVIKLMEVCTQFTDPPSRLA